MRRRTEREKAKAKARAKAKAGDGEGEGEDAIGRNRSHFATYLRPLMGRMRPINRGVLMNRSHATY